MYQFLGKERIQCQVEYRVLLLRLVVILPNLMGHSDIAVTLNVYTHVGLEDAERELHKMQSMEDARKEMGISDKDDKPLKQNMFKVV